MDIRSSLIGDILTRSGEQYPDTIAVRFTDRSWTYRQLDLAVTSVAARLLESGLSKGDRVAAYGKNSDTFLIGFLACVRAGLVHVPVNFQLTGDALSYIVTQSGARAVLLDSALAANFDRMPGERPSTVLRFDGELLDWALEGSADDGVDPAIFDVSDTDVAQLLYTSGTTAAPKGAVMTHRALVHHYVSSIVALDFTEHDEVLHALPLYHSAQMHVFLMPNLAMGATNHIIPAPTPDAILGAIAEHHIDSFFAAPTVWVALANSSGLERLASLRKAYYGASIMPVTVLRRLQEQFPDIGFYNCFGQSEMGPLCTVLRPEDHADRPGSAGKPILFVSLRLVGPDGADVAPGEPGEVLYRSPQLCEGYWDKPDETAAAFSGGWFHSGDLATQDDQGYITIVDRLRDVINTGGIVVASREIEDVVYELGAVGEVAVVGVPDDKWIEAVTAFIVRKGDLTADEVIEHARSRLAAYKVPKRIEFVAELPRNASGKILKRELRTR
ncbi:fatty acyl-CoA synthetase [Spelaeicoccus albus]|uniref:Fatty-acyl-CoA synthase n=1 Tax=Spelaeicoccus albus TaxID=1280376 RepID=A0A7Z0D3P6_9MICO|nr:fatty acyl-CoA synthetase [Spelaeicoccus albus]NYI68310.1 fatty-acyl-CoA synthase [Spelaeicoccus albus]